MPVLDIDCPTCGRPVESYEVIYAYADCPAGCGNPVKTPCKDRMALKPCGHDVIGQDTIYAVETHLV